jgi:hypothetical protein
MSPDELEDPNVGSSELALTHTEWVRVYTQLHAQLHLDLPPFLL